MVTGAGRGFCAGADISAVFDAQLSGDAASSTPAATPARTRDWVELIRSTKPIVAAVNGPAVGVGLTMILPFDRIVVAEGAKLSVRFVKMGLVPELASSSFLPQRCGFGAANDLMLSGRTVLGNEAVTLGLADECVADDAVVDVAIERARSYAENPTPQLRWIKQLITQNANEVDSRVDSASRDRGAAAGLRDPRAQGSGRGVPREAQAQLPIARTREGRHVSSLAHRRRVEQAPRCTNPSRSSGGSRAARRSIAAAAGAPVATWAMSSSAPTPAATMCASSLRPR